MASREQNRREARRDTVNHEDRLAAELIDDDRLTLDGMPSTPSPGPFARFAATPDRLAELDRGRLERLTMRSSDLRRSVSVDDREPVREATHMTRTIAVSELTRLADRLVEAREQLATAEERLRSQQTLVEIAAADASAARAETAQLQDRLVAARAIVIEAQRTMHAAIERCAYVEGRADALESALDQALSTSFFGRRRMRRDRTAKP